MRQLPTALQLHILSLLPPNERALSGRLAFRDAADAFSAAEDRTACLGQQLPSHAVPWALEAGQEYVRQLPFLHKFHLLCTAARSGSEVNLQVALALLQPSTFPELLQNPECSYRRCFADPGVAAVTAGHPQLLGWLLSRCPGLLCSRDILAAAARRCDLAGLREVWEALQARPSGCSSSNNTSSGSQPRLDQHVLDTAAGSATPDAVAKVQWVLAAAQNACRLERHTATSAVLAGNLELLRWLRQEGCDPPSASETLNDAYILGQAASVPVARWLVDEAGYELPLPASLSGPEGNYWHVLLHTVAQNGDGVAKLRWLQERGAPPLAGDGSTPLLFRLIQGAAMEGQLETLRYLVPLLGQGRATRGSLFADCAAASGSIPVAEYLRQAGWAFTDRAYVQAATRGDVAMVRWLAQEAGVSAEGLDLARFMELWPSGTTACNRDLLEAVQVVVGVAGCRRWDAEGVMNCAAARGDLALVQYLQGQLQQQGQQQGQRGRWPDGEALAGVAIAGCEALQEWLVERHPSCRTGGGPTGSPYVLAAENGDRGTLAALRRLGVPWDAQGTVVQALLHGCELPVLRWLVEQGAPVGRAGDMEEAVARRVGREDLNAEEAAWLRGLAGAAEAAAAAAAED